MVDIGTRVWVRYAATGYPGIVTGARDARLTVKFDSGEEEEFPRHRVEPLDGGRGKSRAKKTAVRDLHLHGGDGAAPRMAAAAATTAAALTDADRAEDARVRAAIVSVIPPAVIATLPESHMSSPSNCSLL